MGWANWLLIPEWKLAVEFCRNDDVIDEDTEQALNYITENEDYCEDNPRDKRLLEWGCDYLRKVLNAFNVVNNLTACMPIHLLMWFLRHRKIPYTIQKGDMSGEQRKELKKQGWVLSYIKEE